MTDMPPSINHNHREPIEMVTPLFGSPFGSFPAFTIVKPKQKVAPVRLFSEDILAFIENNLAALQENWDGYGAHPIHPEVLNKLSNLINSIAHTFWAVVSEDEISPNPS